MRKLILLGCLITLLSACKNRNEQGELPASILKQDKLVAVLVDIHLEEAKLNSSVDVSKPMPKIDTISFIQVFKRNHITKAEFDSSMVFYTQHPKLMNETYDKVIEVLSEKKTDAEKKPKQ